MTASTISGNHTGAGGMGGGAGIPGEQSNGSFRSAGPAATGAQPDIGGGLLSDGNASGTLTNVTIAGNFTGNGGKGGAGYSGATGLGGGSGGYGGYGGGTWATGANNIGPLQLTHATISQNGLGAAGAGGQQRFRLRQPRASGRGSRHRHLRGRPDLAAWPRQRASNNTLIASNGLLEHRRRKTASSTTTRNRTTATSTTTTSAATSATRIAPSPVRHGSPERSDRLLRQRVRRRSDDAAGVRAAAQSCLFRRLRAPCTSTSAATQRPGP